MNRIRSLTLAAALLAAAIPAAAEAAPTPAQETAVATATPTKQAFVRNEFSDAKLFALIAEHNKGVIDDHLLMAALDGEAGTIDNNYEAQLTAKEIPYTGYTPTETAVAAPVPAWAPGGLITETLLRNVVDQVNARVADIRAVVAKLNGDDGIAAADYTSTAKKVIALGVEAAAGETAEIQKGAGAGPDGRLIQHLVDSHNLLSQNWHDVAVKLDADGGTAASYESQMTAKTITAAA